jgi:hypothetical protein
MKKMHQPNNYPGPRTAGHSSSGHFPQRLATEGAHCSGAGLAAARKDNSTHSASRRSLNETEVELAKFEVADLDGATPEIGQEKEIEGKGKIKC